MQAPEQWHTEIEIDSKDLSSLRWIERWLMIMAIEGAVLLWILGEKL